MPTDAPTVLAGYDRDGRVTRWTTAAKDRPQPSLDPMEELKKDIQVQRALDVIKTMRIIEQQRPGTSPQAQVRQ